MPCSPCKSPTILPKYFVDGGVAKPRRGKKKRPKLRAPGQLPLPYILPISLSRWFYAGSFCTIFPIPIFKHVDNMPL